MGRTGSTMLVSLLDSHPQIECRGELFRPDGDYQRHAHISRRAYLEQHAYETGLPIRGFKMPLDWILNHPGIFDDFRALGYKMIRLDRKRILDHFLSIRLAITNAAFDAGHEYSKPALEIDPWQLVKFVGARNVQTTILDRFSADFETLHVDYDELTSESCQRRLLDFLGAAPRALTAGTVRQRRESLRNSITNYDALAAFLRASPLASLLPPHDRA